MKVAIIIERANIALGGAQRSVFELVMALSAKGLKVDIIAASGQVCAKNIHILCHNDSNTRTRFSTFAKALKQHLSANRYEIVHSTLPFDFADIYQPRGGTYAESILRNAASYNNKLVTAYKKLTSFANLRRTILLRAERKLCQNQKGPMIIALSQYVANQFQQRYRTTANRIVLIPNGVNTDKTIDVKASDRLRAQILTHFGIKEADEPVLFLFAANNFRLKGLCVLIEALYLAIAGRRLQRDPFLVVAGSGKPQRFRRIAKKLNIHKKILFLGPVKHIQNALSIIDVAILPTFYDPSSRFTLEAIAAEKPVITTRYNGAVDLFTPDRHGKVITEPHDVCALADAIAYFTDTNNIQNTSQAILADKLRESISIRRVTGQLIRTYETILQKKRAQ
jgi:glycosyltransferase involved in cell wall biosynthesis